MPSNISHKILVDHFVGGDYNWVNHMMDSTVKLPRKQLNKIMPSLVDPSSHRKDWVHTKDYWFMMYMIDFDTFYSAIVHLTFDDIDTKQKHLIDNYLNPDWKIKREQAKSLNSKK
jgi:hypothetical protein